VPGNAPEDRELTSRLYGGDGRTRIRQELLLGVGGFRALKAMGISPGVLHLNEGHSGFAVFEAIRNRMEEEGMDFAHAASQVPREVIMRAMAEATIAAIPDRSAAAVGRLTGLAYTLTHEELRVQVREVTAQSYAFGARWLRAVTKEEDLPMPADQLVRVIHALIEGLVFQRLLTPELVPDEVFRAAFGALAKKPNNE